MPLNFDQKVYTFPDSWIELRKELYNYWREDLPSSKVPNWNDPRCGWALAFDAPLFTEYMNTALGGVLNVAMVTNDKEFHIDYICKTFLKELRKRRGELNP